MSPVPGRKWEGIKRGDSAIEPFEGTGLGSSLTWGSTSDLTSLYSVYKPFSQVKGPEMPTAFLEGKTKTSAKQLLEFSSTRPHCYGKATLEKGGFQAGVRPICPWSPDPPPPQT